jgi:hypothetical protein
MLDEWSSVPRDLQPYLAEFLVRCVLPLQRFTVKVAAIEQQASFRAEIDGTTLGLELGADMSATITLDDSMVFERNEERARNFFLGLFYKHLTAGADEVMDVDGLGGPADIVRLGFTDTRAFDELIRAAEGVPRDALSIAARAAMHDRLLLALFDARVLHVVRRGYSAQDRPGERYEVWVIDYGAYVDLVQTKYAPQGDLPIGSEGEGGYNSIDVPKQDLRAIRRAILDLDTFSTEDSGRQSLTFR